MREIKERRKRFLAMLLGLIVFFSMPSISSYAANVDLGADAGNKAEKIGSRLNANEKISWHTGNQNFDVTVHYLDSDGTLIMDDEEHYVGNASGATLNYTVLSSDLIDHLWTKGKPIYWELISVVGTANKDVTEITLKAYYKETNSNYDQNDGDKHVHSYDWVVTKSPTEEEDGEEAYMCSCGSILYTLPLTAAGEFMNEVIRKINKAPSGATVEITTNKWLCFNKAVCEAYALRPDVTLKINYREEGYKGTKLTTVVPAGTDLRNYLNEEGYVGFLYLRTLFTTTINQ